MFRFFSREALETYLPLPSRVRVDIHIIYIYLCTVFIYTVYSINVTYLSMCMFICHTYVGLISSLELIPICRKNKNPNLRKIRCAGLSRWSMIRYSLWSGRFHPLWVGLWYSWADDRFTPETPPGCI